jgi:hypothetical protein
MFRGKARNLQVGNLIHLHSLEPPFLSSVFRKVRKESIRNTIIVVTVAVGDRGLEPHPLYH